MIYKHAAHKSILFIHLLMLSAVSLAGLNTAPTAAAGADDVRDTLDTVTLNGSGSDPNDPNQTLTYDWQQISGTPVMLSATDVVNPEFEAPKILPGLPTEELVFSLVVNDGIEDSAPDTVTITIQPFAAAEPVFNAVVINRFLDPSDSRETLGDLLFSPDGTQVHLIVDSEGNNGRVLVADVVRDEDQNVSDFENWTELFSRPNIDTGLTYALGSDTLMYHVEDIGIGQRTNAGVQEEYTIINYNSEYGGLVVIPEPYSNAGQIIKAEYELGRLFTHDLSNDGDGTFTVSPGVLLSELALDSTGDLEYING